MIGTAQAVDGARQGSAGPSHSDVRGRFVDTLDGWPTFQEVS
jgi:hypothetical protein